MTNHHVDDKAIRRLLSRQRPHESDIEFARRIGVSQQLLSNWKLGKDRMSREKAVEIVQKTGWGLDWLLRGEVSEGASYQEGVADARNLVDRHHEQLRTDLDELEPGSASREAAQRLDMEKAPSPENGDDEDVETA